MTRGSRWGNERPGVFGRAKDFGIDPERGEFAAHCPRHGGFYQSGTEKNAFARSRDTRLWCNACRGELGLSQLSPEEACGYA